MMMLSEDIELDRALDLCKLIQKDLSYCVGIVKRLDNKYNEPYRYAINMKPFDVDSAAKPPSVVSFPRFSFIRTMSMPRGSRSGGGGGGDRVEGRSSHELNMVFVDLKSKCIKLRRDLEATAAQAQRLAVLSLRQDRVQHRMLKDAQSSETFVCKHWGNNAPQRVSSYRRLPPPPRKD
ncbi:uncharacterized protein LOC108598232 [Drosophila busckii]|uniref:uncharacterized protein LOC108598232 n=1 Tax=Drosophila busckii TaxID=30019 RepID=UPI00083F34DB|nr:uncharacterized protein LOC108598232 [Drosophila busckii]